MWSSVIVTDPDATTSTVSGVLTVPAGAPESLAEIAGSAASGFLLVLATRPCEPWLRTALTLAAGRWPEVRFAWRASDHAPLALLAAASSAQLSTPEPALGVQLVDDLLACSWSGAWVTSVAGVSRPVPSLAQHARSLLPGSAFLLRQWPRPAVLGDVTDDAVPPAPVDRVLLAQDTALPPPVVSRLAAVGRPTAIRAVGVPGSWRSAYGRSAAGQLALVPADAGRLLRRPTWRCPSCELQQAGDGCPFCRLAAPVAGDPAATPAAAG